MTSRISDCKVYSLGRIHNPAGNITVVEDNKNIPFGIRRVYYLYDIPGGETRGGHAHKALYQMLIAASGSFEVLLDDGKQSKTVRLNRPGSGLLIVPGIWRELLDFSSGAVCLALASEKFDESDYIRDYNTFLGFMKSKWSN